jgi:hypothetical protein
MNGSRRRANRFGGQQITVDFASQLKRQLLEEVAWRARMTSMIVAKLKVWAKESRRSQQISYTQLTYEMQRTASIGRAFRTYFHLSA